MFIKIKDKTINLSFVDCFSAEENRLLFSSTSGYFHEVVCESDAEAQDIYQTLSQFVCAGQIKRSEMNIINNFSRTQ